MFRTAAVAAFGLSVLAGPLYAQSDNAADPALEAGAENQVSVNIDTLEGSLADQIADALAVEAEELPGTVEVPPGIAAQVCEDTSAADLAKSEGEAATCDATTTNEAFNNYVQAKIDGEAGLETEMDAETDPALDAETDAELDADTEMETETESQ